MADLRDRIKEFLATQGTLQSDLKDHSGTGPRSGAHEPPTPGPAADSDTYTSDAPEGDGKAADVSENGPGAGVVGESVFFEVRCPWSSCHGKRGERGSEKHVTNTSNTS